MFRNILRIKKKASRKSNSSNSPDFPDPAVVLGFVIKGFIVKGFPPEEVDGCSVEATSVIPLLLLVLTREEVSAAFPFIWGGACLSAVDRTGIEDEEEAEGSPFSWGFINLLFLSGLQKKQRFETWMITYAVQKYIKINTSVWDHRRNTIISVWSYKYDVCWRNFVVVSL